MSIFNTTLFKVAFGGGVFVVGSCKWMENRMRTNFREQEWYKKGVQMFHQYKPAEDYLGSPVSNGHVNLSKLMVIECEANAAIPVKGPKGKGLLWIYASRESIKKSWEIDQLDLEISATEQRWKFYERVSKKDGNAEKIPEENDKITKEEKREAQ